MLERPAREMLLGVGGLLAIVLGPVFFVLDVVLGFAVRGLVAVIVNVIFGFLLLASAGLMRRNLVNGTVLAFIASILLLALGDVAGLIGGLFGLVGALLTLLANYKRFLP